MLKSYPFSDQRVVWIETRRFSWPPTGFLRKISWEWQLEILSTAAIHGIVEGWWHEVGSSTLIILNMLKIVKCWRYMVYICDKDEIYAFDRDNEVSCSIFSLHLIEEQECSVSLLHLLLIFFQNTVQVRWNHYWFKDRYCSSMRPRRFNL